MVGDRDFYIPVILKKKRKATANSSFVQNISEFTSRI